MSLYKWIFKRLTGIELKDPPVNVEPESNDAEQWLLKDTSWPKKIKGEFFLIDAGVGDDDYANWANGTFEIENYKDPILVEFNGSVLKEAGITLSFEFSKKTVLWVNEPINEYFQVAKIEKI